MIPPPDRFELMIPPLRKAIERIRVRERALAEKVSKDPEKLAATLAKEREERVEKREEVAYARGVARGKEQGEVLGEARAIPWLEAQGEARGMTRSVARSVIRLLEKRRIPTRYNDRERILECNDVDQLYRWFDRAVEASSVEEVLAG